MSQGCQRHRSLQQALAVLALALLASGCTPFRPGVPSEPAASEQSSASQQGVGAVIAQQALAQVGAPYRYGGADPARGFDCSGLVSYAHSREGISVPRTAAAQFAAARKVDPACAACGRSGLFPAGSGQPRSDARRHLHGPATLRARATDRQERGRGEPGRSVLSRALRRRWTVVSGRTRRRPAPQVLASLTVSPPQA